MPYFIIYKLKWILTVYFKTMFSRFPKRQIVLQDLFGLQKFYEFWLCLWGSFFTKIFPFMLGHFCVITLNGNNLTIISSFSLIFLTNFTSYYYHSGVIRMISLDMLSGLFYTRNSESTKWSKAELYALC